MNKKISIIIGVVVVIGLVFYFSMNKTSAPSQTELKSEVNNSNDSKTSLQSLKDLLAKNEPVKCEYKSEGATGNFYIANKKVRGDMNIPVDGKTMVSHMIIIDDTSYTWNDGAKTGFKITADKNASTPKNESNPPVDQQSSVDVEKPMAYNCGAWSVDSSYFELPAGVEFSDLSSLMPTITPESTENKTSKPDTQTKDTKCAACDSVPESTRAQCKTAMGCN